MWDALRPLLLRDGGDGDRREGEGGPVHVEKARAGNELEQIVLLVMLLPRLRAVRCMCLGRLLPGAPAWEVLVERVGELGRGVAVLPTLADGEGVSGVID